MIQPVIEAKWKKLLMVNYAVKEEILLPFLPHHTQFATWNGTLYVSLVGFLFLDVTLGGISIPLHTDFVEVNLRFYVKRHDGQKWRHGVVFLKEIVALPAVSFVANTFVNEHYETMPLRHVMRPSEDELFIEYRWKKEEWNSINLTCAAEFIDAGESTSEYFLTAQHWGYTKLSETNTREYSVEHPRWDVYRTKEYHVAVDFEKVFGQEFGFLGDKVPDSVFLAEGSQIVMRKEGTLSV